MQHFTISGCLVEFNFVNFQKFIYIYDSLAFRWSIQPQKDVNQNLMNMNKSTVATNQYLNTVIL